MTIRTIFSILIILQSAHIVGVEGQIPEPPIKNYGVRRASAPNISLPSLYNFDEETDSDSSDSEGEIYIDPEDEKKNDE